jgi:hypothetical protein
MINETIIENRSDYELPCLRTSIGFDFRFNFNDKLGIQTGVGYSIKGYRHKLDNTLFGLPEAQLTGVYRNNFQHHYAELPVLLGFTLPMKKIVLELNLGTNNAFYITTSSQSKTEFSDGSEIETTVIEPVYERFLVQAQAYFPVKWSKEESNMIFRLGPEFKCGINSIIDAPIQERPFTAGIKFSMSVSK